MTTFIEFRTSRPELTAAQRAEIAAYIDRAMNGRDHQLAFVVAGFDPGVYISGTRVGNDDIRLASNASRDFSDLCWRAVGR